MRREGRTSQPELTKSISTKGRQRKSSGCALKVIERNRFTPGGLLWCHGVVTGVVERRHILRQQSAQGVVGRRSWLKARTVRSGK